MKPRPWKSERYAMSKNMDGVWEQYNIVGKDLALALIAGAAAGKLSARGIEHGDEHNS